MVAVRVSGSRSPGGRSSIALIASMAIAEKSNAVPTLRSVQVRLAATRAQPSMAADAAAADSRNPVTSGVTLTSLGRWNPRWRGGSACEAVGQPLEGQWIPVVDPAVPSLDELEVDPVVGNPGAARVRPGRPGRRCRGGTRPRSRRRSTRPATSAARRRARGPCAPGRGPASAARPPAGSRLSWGRTAAPAFRPDQRRSRPRPRRSRAGGRPRAW